MDTLVSTQWLAEHLGEPDLAIVDSSAFMPADGRDGRAEFLEAHIPGARFLDINELSPTVPIPRRTCCRRRRSSAGR